MRPPDPRYLSHIIQAATRLYFASLGTPPETLYDRTNPEDDEHVLINLMEEARDAWRTIRRSRSEQPMER